MLTSRPYSASPLRGSPWSSADSPVDSLRCDGPKLCFQFSGEVPYARRYLACQHQQASVPEIVGRRLSVAGDVPQQSFQEAQIGCDRLDVAERRRFRSIVDVSAFPGEFQYCPRKAGEKVLLLAAKLVRNLSTTLRHLGVLFTDSRHRSPRPAPVAR